MRWSFQIGRLFGIPVRVHLSLVLFLALIAWMGNGPRGVVILLALLGSVVLHELGHALVARGRGLPIADISLHPFGGMARMLAPPRSAADEIVVAAAGPAVSLALAGGFALLALVQPIEALRTLAWVNGVIGVFNLLPALPMDGGRILRAALSRRLGYYRATALAARLARWLALGVAVAGFWWSPWMVAVAAFMLVLSVAEEATARARRFMGDPGYQDSPDAAGPGTAFTPSDSAGSYRVPGSNWEVLGQEPRAPRRVRRVERDEHGNLIITETWER